jgi:hypothetical protein
LGPCPISPPFTPLSSTSPSRYLAVAALEVLALVLAKRNTRAARGALMGSAIVGGIGLWALYEAGEHGGDLVYRYAGGVGIRYGDTADVNRHG